MPRAAFRICRRAAMNHHERIAKRPARRDCWERNRVTAPSRANSGAPALCEARLAGTLVAAHQSAARNLEQTLWLTARLTFQRVGQVVASVRLQPLRARLIALWCIAQQPLHLPLVAHLGTPTRERASAVPAQHSIWGRKRPVFGLEQPPVRSKRAWASDRVLPAVLGRLPAFEVHKAPVERAANSPTTRAGSARNGHVSALHTRPAHDQF